MFPSFFPGYFVLSDLDLDLKIDLDRRQWSWSFSYDLDLWGHDIDLLINYLDLSWNDLDLWSRSKPMWSFTTLHRRTRSAIKVRSDTWKRAMMGGVKRLTDGTGWFKSWKTKETGFEGGVELPLNLISGLWLSCWLHSLFIYKGRRKRGGKLSCPSGKLRLMFSLALALLWEGVDALILNTPPKV